jgi:hypothetical protein
VSHRPPLSDEGERRLLDRAARWPGHASWSDLTAEELRRVAEREGIDFATALLYDRVRRSPEHGPFIRRLEAVPADGGGEGDPRTLVAIAPGGFYREFPHTGADGRPLREEAARLGLRSELIPLRSFGPLADNACILSDWLAARPDGERIILASLSKGGSDIKIALAQPGAEQTFRNVAVWVNLSGLLWGTPLVDWLLARRLRTLWVRFLFRLRGYDFAAIPELGRGPGTPLDFDVRLPPHLRVIHVVGFPLVRHLSNGLARRCFRRVRPLGPNDGAGIVLADVARLPGWVYPLWGADHYLRPAGTDRGDLVRRILAAARDILAESTPEPVALGSAPSGEERLT